MFRFWVIFLTVSVSLDCYLCKDELVSVVVLFRHGDRTPYDTYPNDPYRDESYWPADFGQLTYIGKQQHYELGKWFRQRYDGFLPKKYNENDIYVRSTDVDRALMSAASNLAGLYPPEGEQVWNDDIPWQPIPIHTRREEKDEVLALYAPCPKYDQLEAELRASDYFKEIDKNNEELYEYLSNSTGMNVTGLRQVEDIYNILVVEEVYNFTLPEWTRGEFPEILRPYALLNLMVSTFTYDMARLKIGPLFSKLIEHFKYFSGDSPRVDDIWNRKFVMLSAHDYTIISILNALNKFDNQWPWYASSLIMEMYKTAHNTTYVNFLYRNNGTLQSIYLHDCDDVNCPLEIFLQNLEPLALPSDQWKKECQL